jgi:hypothetical protein
MTAQAATRANRIIFGISKRAGNAGNLAIRGLPA